MLEYIKCNICQSTDTEELYVKNSFHIVKCKKCGLVYVNPRPDTMELKQFYRDKKLPSFTLDTEPTGERDLYLYRFNKRLRNIEVLKKRGRLLDIGCAWGYFLELAKKHNWESYGVELSERASYYCREKLHLNVFTGRLEEASYPDQYFNVVTMFHLLEHIPNPRNFLREINRILRKKGLVVIEVPNIGSLKSKVAGEKWRHLVPPMHLYYFSPKTLSQLLRETGFQPVRAETCGGSGILATMKERDMKNIYKRLVKYFRYLSWIKSLLEYAQKLFRLNDNLSVYARKE